MPKSEAAVNYAKVIELIMNSVGNTAVGKVAFVMDTLLVVKHPDESGDSALMCKQLTRMEQDYLNQNQHLLGTPANLLKHLSGVAANQIVQTSEVADQHSLPYQPAGLLPEPTEGES